MKPHILFLACWLAIGLAQGQDTRGVKQSHEETEQVMGKAKYYALIMAVSDYTDEGINDLDKPIIDAGKLKDVLTTQYEFEPANVKMLKNPTKAQMYEAFEGYIGKLGENDNLVVFYAGHGHWDKDLKQGYWLPSDAKSGARYTWFPNDDLQRYMDGIKSKHLLLISDACFSGGIFKSRDAFTEMQPYHTLYGSKSRTAMTSGSLQTVPDESAFIKYLLQYLTENRSDYLSAEEVFGKLKKVVMVNNNNSQNIPLYGEVHNTGHEYGDFIFKKRANTQTTTNLQNTTGLSYKTK